MRVNNKNTYFMRYISLANKNYTIQKNKQKICKHFIKDLVDFLLKCQQLIWLYLIFHRNFHKSFQSLCCRHHLPEFIINLPKPLARLLTLELLRYFIFPVTKSKYIICSQMRLCDIEFIFMRLPWFWSKPYPSHFRTSLFYFFSLYCFFRNSR